MGDVRFTRLYERLRSAPNPAEALHALHDEEVIMALAAASREHDPLLANVLATEGMNRALRGRAIARHIAEGVYVLDRDGRFSLLNPAAQRLVGWRESEVLGRPVEEAIHLRPEGPEHVRFHPEAEVLREGRPIQREDLFLRHRDGQWRPISYSCAPIVRDGFVNGVITSFRDISARRAAEARIASSERHYRLLAENSTDIITCTDTQGIFTYVSPSARAILGHAPEDLVGRAWSEFVHPDDIAWLAGQRGRIPQGGEIRVQTYRGRRADGSYVWLESTSRALPPDDGSFGSIISSSRDVTPRMEALRALRDSEERLQLVLTSLPVIACAINRQGRITLLEGRGLQGMGLDAADLVGRHVVEVAPNSPEIAEALRNVLSGVESTIEAQFRGRWLRIRSAPIRSTSGEIIGASGVATDITEQRWVTDELRRAHERLILLEDMLDELVAQPFGEENIVQGFASVLARHLPWLAVIVPGDQPRRFYSLAHADPHRNALAREQEELLRDLLAWASSRVTPGVEPVLLHVNEVPQAGMLARVGMPAREMVAIAVSSNGGPPLFLALLRCDDEPEWSPMAAEALRLLARRMEYVLRHARLLEQERQARQRAEQAITRNTSS